MTPAVDTRITQIQPNKILVKGYNLVDLAGKRSFGDLVYLLARGELPAGREGQLLEAMLICCVDHGLNTPSTHVARSVANCGVPIQSAVAAGISAIGDHHGGAGETLAQVLQALVQDHPAEPPEALAQQVIAHFTGQGQRVPGFGHRFHNPDPRAVLLFDLAEQWGLSGQYTALGKAIEGRLAGQTGRALPINVDGALAVLLSDIGFPWRYARAIFLIARTPGLVAHVDEELERGKPFQFIHPVSENYTGPEERSLP